MLTLPSLCIGISITLAAIPVGLEPPAEWGERVTWEDEGPEAREHASVMQFGDNVVLYAGSGYEPQMSPLSDAWVYDVGQLSWQMLQTEGDVPAGGGSMRVALTDQSSEAYLFGGYDGRFVCNNELYRATYKEDTLSFERIEQINAPSPRALHAFVFDPKSERFIVTLGVSHQGFRGDTWLGEFNEDGEVVWNEINNESSPAPRFGFAYGFDSETGLLVLFSGQLEAASGNQMPMASDVWTLNTRAKSPGWNQVSIPEGIEGRRNPCFAFDDVNDRLAVWCGTADARSNVDGVVWIERDDESWKLTQAEEGQCPPKRSSGFGFADPKTGNIIFGFGNSASGRYQDWVTLLRGDSN